MDKLANLIQRMHVHLGIITVPAEAAQSVADQLVEAGVKAIWNFAPTALKVPPTVILQNAELSSELAVLSVMLTHARRKSLMAEAPEPPDSHPPSCSSNE
jgi:redox-sensing transcriptional repressor